MALTEKLLSACTLRSIDKLFKTRELSSLPSLDEWMAQPADMSELEEQILLCYQKGLAFNVHDWNEYELDTYFIGPVFSLADFSSPYFNYFGQRDIDAIVDGTLLYGRIDGMIASGRREPELPYFAFQEYKRNLDPNGGPA